MKLLSIRSRSCFSGLLLVVASGLIAGCGGGGPTEKLPPIYPTTGVIKWKGKPVEGALVSFNPTEKGGRAGTGTTNAQGEFSLETYHKPGCTVGEKIVTVSKIDSPPADPKTGAFPNSKQLLPDAVTNISTASLRVAVKADGKNHFELAID